MPLNTTSRRDVDADREGDGLDVEPRRDGDTFDARDDGAERAATIMPGRGEMVGLALQIDAMIARSDEMSLDLVAYLLGVARAELGDRLGERPRAVRARTGDAEAFRGD